jgi:hypothetical protein
MSEQEKVQLSLQDIATVIQMIDITSRRGAYEGRELAGVGMLRNKFEMFLQQNAPQGEKPQGAMPAAVPEGPLADKVQE